jgi:glycosyltransferase involved in cell wall biosynthesis
VVGPGKRFLGGITYYTYGLSRALADEARTSTVLLRQLLPRRLYPGRARVGAEISPIEIPAQVPVFDGIDWYLVPSLARAFAFLHREQPKVIVLQWWTGTVLHVYLLLALVLRRRGVKVIVEFHEVQDPGESEMPLVAAYVRRVAPWLFRRADGYVVHSEYDRALLHERFALPERPTAVIPHATYDHYRQGNYERTAPEDACNLLFFGLIRPYKGLDVLLAAFEQLSDDEAQGFWLTIVGESWEDAAATIRAVEASPRRDRITLVNRYVTDAAVVLPYHRSSQSGALHIAMNYGLPVVVSSVGGLVEAVDGYDGAALVPPADPAALARAVRALPALKGRVFPDPRGWDATARRYLALYDQVVDGVAAPAPAALAAGAERSGF